MDQPDQESEPTGSEVAGRESDVAEELAEHLDEQALPAESHRTDLGRAELGPFDESEEDDDVPRIDLGALRLPVREGMELRLELEEQTQQVVAATVSLGGSSVQLQAFAAPRSEGVWDDIRTEIAASVTRQGGTADDIVGSLGRELLARIPARMADGRSGYQVVRFTGVDGPRWFLRAVFHGPAASDDQAAQGLEEVVRATVVVRGKEAMAPRDLLSLTLPPTGQAQEGAEDEAERDEAGPEDGRRQLPDPLRRGPEITEIR